MSQDFKTPRADLAPGSTHAGFVVERAEQLPEISGCAYVLRHSATGARAMWLACPDDNKAFAIAFKTPPANSTGVFHILEHSVLCGSDRFPVKEPFVHLLKSSMQTFLNALTFSDKTMYPVASTNDRDLENLMDIYLDAVLHPAIYARPRIFEQEGWHYEVAGLEGAEGDQAEGAAALAGDAAALAEGDQAEGAAALAEGTAAPTEGTAAPTEGASEAAEDAAAAAEPHSPSLSYNGVVYNEMRGAFSNPEELLLNGIAESLFADGPYGWVSGGDPACIPTLTYEEFINTHARHYQLSNSYTMLYGDLDIEEKLAFLDKRFSAAEVRGAGAPNPLPMHEPVAPATRTVTMDTTPDNACCAAAYVFATASQRERVLAADILLDALAGSNEAPLKRAVLESGLGRDLYAFVYDGLLQPMLIFELKGAKPGVADEFRALVEHECARLVEKGLGADNLEASLAQAEFNLREGDWGYPDGVGLAIQAMSGWLYDDEAATSYLRYEDELAHMRESLASGYFERLLREAVCENSYACAVELVPTPGEGNDASAARLAELAASMSAEQLGELAREAEALHAEQAAPDSAEALATLPHLELADIGEGAPEPTSQQVDAPIPCWHHNIDTRGITYAYWYFDLGCVAFDELPYVSVLAGLLGKLDTSERSAYALDTLCESKLGNLSFFSEVYNTDGDAADARPKLVVGASALSHNVEWLAKLPAEIWSRTQLGDRDRIRGILEQRRIGMEMAFVDSGHAAALSRLTSYYMASGVVSEQLGGVDFYRFLRELLDNFDERFEGLQVKLEELMGRIFAPARCELSLTGPDNDVEAFWACANGLEAYATVNSGATAEPSHTLWVPAPAPKNEAFIVPANVCFVGEGMPGAELGVRPSGTWQVAGRALSFDYLWNEVRVLGGAYGCGFRCTMDSLLQMYSYRDPAVDPTVDRFEAASSWLSGWQPSDEELEGYIVASVAGMDAPVKPRAAGRRLDATRLSGRDARWREQRRSQMLATTLEQLHELASPLAQLPERRAVCVFGGRTQIEAASAELGLTTCEFFSNDEA